MQRLILGLAASVFLACIGIQAVHSHPAKAPESCQICALGAQSLRHAPAASPAVGAASTAEHLFEKPRPRPRERRLSTTSARAPPPALPS